MKDLNDELYRLAKDKARHWMRLYECLVVEDSDENIEHALNCLYFVFTQCHDEFDELMDKYAELHGYAKSEFARSYMKVEQGEEE